MAEKILLTPLKEGEKVTSKRKDAAMLALAKEADSLTKRPDKENDPWAFMDEDAWQLAEMRKWGTVRTIKDKKTKEWFVTTYGRINDVSGYYGLNVNTGEMISQEMAFNFYHNSRA